MTTDLLNQLTQRFREFTDGYRVNGTLHPLHQLKLEHTIRVSADARIIASESGWPEEEICLAEAVGLFHDIARFPQFTLYHTFSDHDSVDHGDLGAETLTKEGLLDGVPAEHRQLILHSVKYHNKKDLPRILTAHEEKHLRLVRDADRVDIFFVCWDSIRTGQVFNHPEIIMGIDFNGPPTDEVLAQFERGEAIDYRIVKSMADRFVLQLSWMHDLTYNASKRLVRNRRIVENFIDILPVKTDRLLNCFHKTSEFLAES